MNIGIVGGDGFVAKNLANTYRQNAFKVTAYGRNSVDLTRPATLRNIADDHDVIVNCAGYMGGDSSTIWGVNLQGVIELCKELNSRMTYPYLIQLSTGGVYGYSESVLTIARKESPDGEYALSKYLADEVIRCLYKGKAGVCRLFFPYGAGQSKERLVPRLMNSIWMRQKIDLSGSNGRPLINPIYIDDLCDQLLKTTMNRDAGIALFGGAEVLSVKQLAQEIGSVLDVEPIFDYRTDAKLNMYCEGQGRISLRNGLSRVAEQFLRSGDEAI